MHTAPLHNLLWERQIKIWSLFPPPINAMSRGNLKQKEVEGSGHRKLKKLRWFPSIKPWITSDLKEQQNKKKGSSERETGNCWGRSKNNCKSRLDTTRRCAGESWRTSAERSKRCVVRDEEAHRLQAEGGSDRWKSAQSQWTTHSSTGSVQRKVEHPPTLP